MARRTSRRYTTGNRRTSSYYETADADAAIPVGLVTETDSAQSIIPAVSNVIAIGLVTETDSAQSIILDAGNVTPIGLVTEINNAITIIPPLNGPIAIVDLVAPLVTSGDRITSTPDLADNDRVKYQTFLYQGSTQTAHPVLVNQDASFIVSGGPFTSGIYHFDTIAYDDSDGTWGTAGLQTVSIPIGLVTETDLAQPISSDTGNVTPVGLVTETDSAQPISSDTGNIIPIGLVTETDLAQLITSDSSNIIPVGLATETDLAQAINLLLGSSITLGLVTETDSAQPISSDTANVIPIGLVTETDSAQVIIYYDGAAIGYFECDLSLLSVFDATLSINSV